MAEIIFMSKREALRRSILVHIGEGIKALDLVARVVDDPMVRGVLGQPVVDSDDSEALDELISKGDRR